MSYLNESAEVTRLRNEFCTMIRHGGCPSMCKMKMWAQLKNAIVREAYAKASQATPSTALEPFGLKPMRTLMAEFRDANRKYDAGEMSQADFLATAHRISREVDELAAHGRVGEADQDRFFDEYTSSVMASTDVPEFNTPANPAQ